MSSDVLARLLAQAADSGADLVTLLGAKRALTRLGLSDADAAEDVAELRELLSAWRDAKSSVWKSAIGWLTRLLGALLLAGIVMRLGMEDWLK